MSIHVHVMYCKIPWHQSACIRMPERPQYIHITTWNAREGLGFRVLSFRVETVGEVLGFMLRPKTQFRN